MTCQNGSPHYPGPWNTLTAPQVYQVNTMDNIAWARRAGSDLLKQFTQSTTTDGTQIITIDNDGNIVVTSLIIDGVVLTSPTDYSTSGSIITLTAPHDTNQVVSIVYLRSQFTDLEIQDYLMDAVRKVGGDLVARWTISRTNYTVTDTHGELWDPDESIWRSSIESLFILRTAMQLAEERVNSAAVDAIKIKDGDTSIDTSATAHAGEQSAKRTTAAYKDELTRVRSNRSSGFSQGA